MPSRGVGVATNGVSGNGTNKAFFHALPLPSLPKFKPLEITPLARLASPIRAVNRQGRGRTMFITVV